MSGRRAGWQASWPASWLDAIQSRQCTKSTSIVYHHDDGRCCWPSRLVTYPRPPVAATGRTRRLDFKLRQVAGPVCGRAGSSGDTSKQRRLPSCRCRCCCCWLDIIRLAWCLRTCLLFGLAGGGARQTTARTCCRLAPSINRSSGQLNQVGPARRWSKRLADFCQARLPAPARERPLWRPTVANEPARSSCGEPASWPA